MHHQHIYCFIFWIFFVLEGSLCKDVTFCLFIKLEWGFSIVWHSNSDYFLCTSFRANIFNFHNSASSKENNLQNTVKNMYSFKLHKVSFKLHLIGQLKNASWREFKNYRSIHCQVTLGQQNFYSFRNIFVRCPAVFLEN